MDKSAAQMGAIVSKSVALGKNPILRAIRSDPVNEYDSGWQFTDASMGNGSETAPEIWRISEVLDVEPSLSEYIQLPAGTNITRRSANDPWTVS